VFLVALENQRMFIILFSKLRSLGQRYAETSMVLFIATLIQRFEISLPDGYVLEVRKLCFSVIHQPVGC